MKIRVGSRESKLAVAQSLLVMEAIRQAHPEVDLELITMKTTGDRILDRTLDQVGGKGLFVKELDRALLDGRVDITVHSMKDLPMELDPRLPLAAVSRREDPRDVLVLPAGAAEWDRKKPIGCASARRKLQLQRLYPGCQVLPVRGNVLTRLEKLDHGEYGALVLASAGLRRLGLEHRISRYFSTDELLPAAGQGVLAVQCRAGWDTGLLQCVHHQATAAAVTAERAFVQALDGGCSSPVAAYATMENGLVTLRGLMPLQTGGYCIRQSSGLAEEAARTGISLALQMKEGLS